MGDVTIVPVLFLGILLFLSIFKRNFFVFIAILVCQIWFMVNVVDVWIQGACGVMAIWALWSAIQSVREGKLM